MTIYNLTINIGGKIQEYIFADRYPINNVMKQATQHPNFMDATIETLSNGGDDMKPLTSYDFEEYDIETGEFVSD